MINNNTSRERNIVTIFYGDNNDKILYQVTMNGGDVLYTGMIKCTGQGKTEIDCSEWIDLAYRNGVNSGQIRVDYTYYRDDGTTVDTFQVINFSAVQTHFPSVRTQDIDGFYLAVQGIGYYDSEGYIDINIPLQTQNGMLKGKTINKLNKITYIDRYGDEHNSTVTNRIELECYVDTEWLHTTTTNDYIYAELISVLQSAENAHLASTDSKYHISGMLNDGGIYMNCHIKDVETIETYSRYNTTHQVPSLKIVLECYK